MEKRIRQTVFEMILSKPVLPALWVAVFYTLPMAVLLSHTWHNTRPSYRGTDWILVVILTLPGSIIGAYFGKTLPAPFHAIIGLAINSIFGYFLALLISHLAERYGR